MKLEFKKSLTNKIVLILCVLFLFLFLLGYFLPVGIDKVKHLGYGQYFFSAYTVATEFGFLLFSFIIAYFINKEYSNKNTLFYKLIGDNVYTFFYKKALVLFVECFLIIWIFITVISLIFGDFTHYLLLLLLFGLVILQYILIIGTISMLFSNILLSIGISIVFWIGSIILVAVNKSIFGIIAPFEASNTMYNRVNKILQNDTQFLSSHNVITLVIFFVALFIINFIVLTLAKKRWLRLGL
ncbi:MULTISPECIES: peptide ABC transporter permease [Staphylococcus]|uniref:Peptide ABC transporter permease n=1 Tax=Staphylococcus pettenkoferi TaxID=170573 RepID=A0A2N6QHP5_9STAP|nr:MULTISPECIES: peptide ABC transporter permease [Staphylococcus]MBX8993154.1 peptide ABC transporter permease [Staphylococcus pettenkoferi]MCI2791605.1 peptide ABC transporter permease [Staphylococcus pettenkoferi]MCY1604465.1 peptide ABC transporter permease [Staphylococcus pettenkoferi]OFK76584.1 peptide ABC transporter permease [Staphylococcus sp. HMSC071G07]PMC19104.1 peptide ABC transporter permease [Staphylococcus pettenkoferi]